ncbi:MAG: peptidoglycan bridge formation glycyltransferase FemA/FemB family protein [Candidatus Paceibacterota bacterium]
MTFREITDKNEWEGFLEKCPEKTFLDSWNWGEFQTRLGFKIWRMAVASSEGLQGVALIVKIKARRGTYLLIQHGPIISDAQNKEKVFGLFLEELKKMGKREGASFVRMNPLWERTEENDELLERSRLRISPMHANAYDATWKLDISLPEEELLKGMRKTTRYLIRQAEKNEDIIIEKSGDLEKYQELNREVGKRQKFVPFSDEYIKDEYEIFNKEGQAVLLFGKYKGEVVAGALVVFYQGTGYYHQAASLSKYAKLSIPYLLQWEAVKEAKRRGCAMYDFWGYVDPKEDPNHPWAGPTLFKMGYGGEDHLYVRTRDYILSPRYWLTFIFEELRKINRRL